VVVFHPRTPEDVLLFLRDFHNTFHDGMAKNPIDTMKEAREINSKPLSIVYVL
jgi:hypothetical protein